jgi:hypothetical protein
MDEGRTPLAEACAQHVPEDLLRRVPDGGISREEAHRLFDDSPYQAIALWADMMNYDTGNFFLDTNQDDYNYNY